MRLRALGETAFALGVLLLLFVNVPQVLGLFMPPVLQYTVDPIPVLSPTVRVGEPVVLDVNRCAFDPLSGRKRVIYTYTRSYVRVATTERVSVPGGQSELPIGCQRIESRTNVVPAGLAAGRYYLEGISLATGTWRTDQVYWRTGEFEVVP